MFSNGQVDLAFPSARTRNAPQELSSTSSIHIVGGSFNDIAGDYHHHVHHAQSGFPRSSFTDFVSMGAAYNSQERHPPPRCHPGTRREILEGIDTWVNDGAEGSSILWLHGPAGAGNRQSRRLLQRRMRNAISSRRHSFLRELSPVVTISDSSFQQLLFRSLSPVQAHGRSSIAFSGMTHTSRNVLWAPLTLLLHYIKIAPTPYPLWHFWLFSMVWMSARVMRINVVS